MNHVQRRGSGKGWGGNARLGSAFLFSLFLASVSTHAQTWETAANHVGDPAYVALPYEVVFVAAKITLQPDSDGVGDRGVYDIGTDVLTAARPSADNHLWVLTRDGQVKKLFPLSVHETQLVTNPDTGQDVPLIDTPAGQLNVSAVVEPNVSEDGIRVYFLFS